MEETAVQALLACMGEYDRAMRKVASELRFGDGLLGLGRDPKKDPCHMKFYEAVGAVVEQMAQRELTAQEAGEAARFLLQLGWEERYHSLTLPMREAIQGHVRPLVPFLAAEEAGELAAWYAQVYPRRRRLPVQSQLLKALERRSREN